MRPRPAPKLGRAAGVVLWGCRRTLNVVPPPGSSSTVKADSICNGQSLLTSRH